MSQAKTITQVLQAAKYIIEEVGWSQSAFFRDLQGHAIIGGQEAVEADYTQLGSVCLEGAINLVEADPELKSQTLEILGNMTRNKYGRYSSVLWFNDSVSTTKQDVVALLDQAIEEERTR